MKQSALMKKVREKWAESLQAVLPIILIVLLLSFLLAPVSASTLLCFLMGAALILVGMMLFTLGAELAMTPMGERMGATLTKSRKLWLLLSVAFALGFIVTVSEPDLQVLAELVPTIPNAVLIGSVAFGVGLFLIVALLRIFFGRSLPPLLIGLYGLVFLLALLVPKDFLGVAFDAGGVTTGPMTVPFIMALGVGLSTLRSDSRAADDSFGLVALCSVGPILSVMILGLAFQPEDTAYTLPVIPEVADSQHLWHLFAVQMPATMHEIAVALLPIVVFFLIFQVLALKMRLMPLLRILMGLAYTYAGLVLFLTGASVGFMPAGSTLGKVLAEGNHGWLLIVAGMVIGWFIVRAEPAVYVLNRQVERITEGAISARQMGISLSIGVAVSLGLAMIRVITGWPILYFLVPGYVLALAVALVVPKIYTAIAFDSGGVASGPMTATFLLPFAQGACEALGGNVVTDAFGVVAMVAMTPLITIQMLGLMALVSARRRAVKAAAAPSFADLDENAIIEL